MRNGHRRTQSDNRSNHFTSHHLRIKLDSINNNANILGLIKESNRRNKVKTVFVESLEVPKAKSEHNPLFFFGKRQQQSTVANSPPPDEILLSIPEHRPFSHMSLQKGIISEYYAREKQPEKSKIKLNLEKSKNKNPYCFKHENLESVKKKKEASKTAKKNKTFSIGGKEKEKAKKRKNIKL